MPLLSAMNFLPRFFCPKVWDDMSGDEAVRFCATCRKSVHNLHLLSVEQKLAMLRNPSDEMCGRYRIAVRRAVPGREPSYFEHLLKHGAGVAVTSVALITLWELSAEAERAARLRKFRVGTVNTAPLSPMPGELYTEQLWCVMGRLEVSQNFKLPDNALATPPVPTPIDIIMDQIEVKKLMPMTEPLKPPPF